MNMDIIPFSPEFEDEVLELWRVCELIVPWNDPRKDIRRKLKKDPQLFLLGIQEGRVAATAMAGYDGHRGWVNYLAVSPELQGQGLGARILAQVEHVLLSEGCPKINLNIRESNLKVQEFYLGQGYKKEAVITMGKRLVADA